MKKFLGIFLGLICAAVLTQAEPTLNARVSASQINLGDSVTLTVEVGGIANLGSAPQLNLPDFQVRPAGQMQSYQWNNGQTTSLISFNYQLSPVKTGTLQIPSISLQAEGKTYSTQPIPVLVIEGGNAAPAAANSNAVSPSGGVSVQVPSEGLKPVFMTADVDVSRAYVGQQILLRVQFLRRPDARISSQPRYSEPDMTGFVVEPLQQQEFTSTLNGAQYDVTELRYALFPTSDGEFAIGSAQIEIAMRTAGDPMDPNSFFQSFFGRSEVVKLKTRPIPINVRALPKNKPSYFTGAVGRYKLTAHADSKELEVGKPFNLILTVEGVGHIKTIKEPELPEVSGLRRYETISDSKISKTGKFLMGSKQFKILMIPQVSGQLVIPGALFSYFNPVDNQYDTERTEDMVFHVKPGNLAQAEREMQTAAAASAGPTEGVRIVEKDIRFIKTGPAKPITPPFVARGLFVVLAALPPLFAFVAFLARRRAEQRQNRASYFRAKDAYRISRKTLAKTRKLIGQTDPIPFYSGINTALTNYLADKFELSSSGLLWEDVGPRLIVKGVSPEMAQEIKYLLDEADMARFAPSSFTDGSRENSLNKASEILKQLEKLI